MRSIRRIPSVRHALEEIRERGVPQTQIARRVGCSPSTLSRIRDGSLQRPRFDLGVKILFMRATLGDEDSE